MTALQKNYSTITSAYTHSVAENGEWGKLSWNSTDEREQLFKDLVLKYLNVSKYCGGINQTECCNYKIYYLNGTTSMDPSTFNNLTYTLSLSSGEIIIAWLHGNGTGVQFYIDLNGEKKPNKYGLDIFPIKIQSIPYSASTTKTGVMFNISTADNPSREDLMESTDNSACLLDKRGSNCGALIQMDSWQIKDDYPW